MRAWAWASDALNSSARAAVCFQLKWHRLRIFRVTVRLMHAVVIISDLGQLGFQPSYATAADPCPHACDHAGCRASARDSCGAMLLRSAFMAAHDVQRCREPIHPSR